MFITKWSELVIDNRGKVILTTLFLILMSIVPMKNLYYDNSNELFFLPGDSNLIKFDQLLERFGDNEYLMVGIEARSQDDSVFTPETLKMISKITNFFEDHEVVTKVSSLSKYQYVHSEDDSLTTTDLIEDIGELDESRENMDRMKKIMVSENLALGQLITSDLKNTLIVARTEYKKGEDDHKIKIVNDLKNFIKNERFKEKGYDLKIFGNPIIAERFITLTKGDQSWMNPLMSIIMMTILFISFRTVAGVLLPWIVIGGSLLIVFGSMGVFNSMAFT